MATSNLAAALIGGGGAQNPMMLADPAIMAAMPDIQIGQGLEQQGLSTAPAYPAQALARLAQTLAGQTMVKGGMSDLAQAYGNSAESMAKIFPAGTPLGDALRSPNPLVRMQALQQAPKAMLLNSERYKLSPGEESYGMGASSPNAVSGQAQSPEGRRVSDAVKLQQAGNQAGARAVESGITKETSTAEGVPFPPTNVQPTPQQMSAARQSLAQGLGAIQKSGVTNTQPTGVVAEDQNIRNQAPQGGMPQSVAGAKSTIAANEQAAKEFVEKETPSFNSAQNLKMRLDIIDHNIAQLGPQWMGAGADAKAEAAKAWNGTLDTFGVSGMHIDPNKVASWEDFNKETTRAGMELIKSNFGGSREAASIIQMGRTAVPSVQNTYVGAKYVSATIRAATQWEIDKYNYKTDLMKQGKPLVGADADFASKHPPQQYAMSAITSQIPPNAVAHLRTNPNLAGQFDKQFGPGTAEFLLGQR